MMALFGSGKKKDAAKKVGKGRDNHTEKSGIATEKATTGGARVKVLGSGCAKCNALETATVEALKELGMETAIEHVTDFAQIAAYGVMTTPALVVDGKAVSFGKVLKKEQVVQILKSESISGG